MSMIGIPRDTGFGWRHARWVFAACTLLLAGAAYYTMALGPIHGVGSADACADAYAKAETHQDSVAVDLLSFPDTTGHGLNNRCGMYRPNPPVSSVLTPRVHD